MRIGKLAAVLFTSLTLTFAVACGDDGMGPGDDDDDDMTVDAGDGADAPDNDVDAPTGGSGGLGETCNGMMGQADCAAGFECLNLQGATNPFCSAECTMTGMQDPVCSDGYTGPGAPFCLLQIDQDNDGEPDADFCGILCEDPSGNFCPNCDGTCPGTLQCNQVIMGGGGGLMACG